MAPTHCRATVQEDRTLLSARTRSHSTQPEARTRLPAQAHCSATAPATTIQPTASELSRTTQPRLTTLPPAARHSISTRQAAGTQLRAIRLCTQILPALRIQRRAPLRSCPTRQEAGTLPAATRRYMPTRPGTTTWLVAIRLCITRTDSRTQPMVHMHSYTIRQAPRIPRLARSRWPGIKLARISPAVGYGCDTGADALHNATGIGAHAIVSQSNSLVLGGTGQYAVRVGIGTTAPSNILTIARGAGHPVSDSWESSQLRVAGRPISTRSRMPWIRSSSCGASPMTSKTGGKRQNRCYRRGSWRRGSGGREL